MENRLKNPKKSTEPLLKTLLNMNARKKINGILLLGTFLCTLNLLHFFSREPKQVGRFITQNTYLGPTESNPANGDLIRVEVLIKDSPDLSGLQIQNVTFNREEIPLKPRDIFGKRGAASFQLPPGKYILRWTVNRDKLIWPRTADYEEEVLLNQRDLWVQIIVEGAQVSIR
ncbi:MAG: hypothetical protein ACHQUC_04125 [Chlamydiales bacterium]